MPVFSPFHFFIRINFVHNLLIFLWFFSSFFIPIVHTRVRKKLLYIQDSGYSSPPILKSSTPPLQQSPPAVSIWIIYFFVRRKFEDLVKSGSKKEFKIRPNRVYKKYLVLSKSKIRAISEKLALTFDLPSIKKPIEKTYYFLRIAPLPLLFFVILAL